MTKRRKPGTSITRKSTRSLLVKLWKRYLLLDLKEEEVYEVDPQTVKPQGDNVEWSLSDLPSDPIETSEWKERDVGLWSETHPISLRQDRPLPGD